MKGNRFKTAEFFLTYYRGDTNFFPLKNVIFMTKTKIILCVVS